MRKQLYWLNDEEWKRLEPLLPRGRRGAHRVDDRRVISGIMHMLRSGARWRDCPPEYGPVAVIGSQQPVADLLNPAISHDWGPVQGRARRVLVRVLRFFLSHTDITQQKFYKKIPQ